MRKKVIAILIIIAVLIDISLIVVGCVMCHKPSREEWAKEIAQFYDDNKDALNEFVKFCYENDIESIKKDYPNLTQRDSVSIEIMEYYVYSAKTLDEDAVRQLSDYLDIFKPYEIFSVVIIDGGYFSGVYYSTGGSGYSVSLVYTIHQKTIEEIQNSCFYKKVKYIDDHWYIAYGEL
jgi:hypothetical protein